MILFLGETSRGFFLDEIGMEYNQEIKYSGLVPQSEEAKKQMLSSVYDYIVVDITQFIDESDVIVKDVNTVCTTSSIPVIVFAPGIQRNAEVLLGLSKTMIYGIITEVTPVAQRKEFKNIISRPPSPKTPDAYQSETDVVSKPAEPARTAKNYKSIALCGACRRIGTTTQAVQIIKYLQFNGYKAAYIEMNNTGFVLQLAQVYSDAKTNKAQHNKVSYRNVDFFYSQEELYDILKMGYDYFVFDYGSAADPTFNAISFIEKDIPIICCGSAPNEWAGTNAVISKALFYDTYYIFNFCDKAEQADVKELMQEKAKKTIFSGYAPDFCVFTADRNNLYDQIIAAKKLNAYKQPKKWPFWKKKGHNDE